VKSGIQRRPTTGQHFNEIAKRRRKFFSRETAAVKS